MKIINLSYILSNNTPSYGSRHKFKIIKEKSILDGDSSNSFTLSFLNHMGTHIDAPNHFHKDGKKIADFEPEELIFNNPQLINVDLSQFNEISKSTIVEEIDTRSDIIFFRTYFSKKRSSREYIESYPVFSSSFANELKNYYPNLRCIGMDIISLTSPLNRDEGTKSHQILLNNDSREIMIIEDMFLDNYNNKIDKAIVIPLMVEGIDSAPCTVYGIY